MDNIKHNDYIKQLNTIAFPLIIHNIAGMLLGFIDQAMVGRISIVAYSAVGVVFSVLSLVVGIVGNTSVIFNIEGSRLASQNNKSKFKDEFIYVVSLNLVIGIFLAMFLLIFKKPILKYLFGFNGAILNEAIKYTSIMTLYIPIQLLLFVFAAVFKIRRNTKYILIASVFSSILNIALDYILIFGKFCIPKLGVLGAALGSIISIAVNLIIYIVLCRDLLSPFHITFSNFIRRTKEYTNKSLPLMMQEILEGSLFVIAINAIISRIGVIEISSYLIIVQFISVISISMHMYGSATLTLVSAESENNKADLLTKLPKTGTFCSMCIYILASIILIIFKWDAPYLITTDSSVAELTSRLMICALIAHVFEVPYTIYKYALQALGESQSVLILSSIINLLALLFMLIFIFMFNLNIYSIFLVLFFNYLYTYLRLKHKYITCHKKQISFTN